MFLGSSPCSSSSRGDSGRPLLHPFLVSGRCTCRLLKWTFPHVSDRISPLLIPVSMAKRTTGLNHLLGLTQTCRSLTNSPASYLLSLGLAIFGLLIRDRVSPKVAQRYSREPGPLKNSESVFPRVALFLAGGDFIFLTSWEGLPLSSTAGPLGDAQWETSQGHTQPFGSMSGQKLCWQMSGLSLGNLSS